MTDYTIRSEPEAKTHELFDKYVNGYGNYTTSVAVLALVFKACWRSCLTRDQIVRTGVVLSEAASFDPDNALKALVKAKVLRSRKERGQRVWEVNY